MWKRFVLCTVSYKVILSVWPWSTLTSFILFYIWLSAYFSFIYIKINKIYAFIKAQKLNHFHLVLKLNYKYFHITQTILYIDWNIGQFYGKNLLFLHSYTVIYLYIERICKSKDMNTYTIWILYSCYGFGYDWSECGVASLSCDVAMCEIHAMIRITDILLK